MMKNPKKLVIVSTIIFIIVIVVIKLIFYNHLNNGNVIENIYPTELVRSMYYNEVTDDDSKIDECDYVRFNAFFIKDLDGDGYAEKYDGTCNRIGTKAALYFDINVLTDGKLEDGMITINGKNFYLSTNLLKDEVIKNNCISSNTTSISLNTINYGTQKLFSGSISDNIRNNINNYSSEDNTITLTGKWVSTDNSLSININKTINLKADWYGSTATSYTSVTTSHDINDIKTQEDMTVSFSVGYQEVKEELLIQKQITEITIPDYNGYKPTSVITTSSNCEYEYDENTQKLTITRQAVTDEDGNIMTSVSRINTYQIQVKYPIEAYNSQDTSEVISIACPTTGYYYGYNNSSEEFSAENPYISSASRTFTHVWRRVEYTQYDAERISSSVGTYSVKSSNGTSRSIVSKDMPLKLYNGSELSGSESNKYVVTWRIFTGDDIEEKQNGIYMEEGKEDCFLGSSYHSMEDYIKITSIYFSGATSSLGDDGWIKVYDADTGNLIKTFTSEEWDSNSSYKFETEVKSIKIETSKANKRTYFYLYQVKEINYDKLIEDFSYDDFNRLNYIYTYLKGGVISSNGDKSELSSASYAYYELPFSDVDFSLSPNSMTSQETKRVTMKISTETNYFNEALWKNGIFVIEMPEEILEVTVNKVSCSFGNVEITSYEVYEENGKQYIKIYTNNKIELDYSLTIVADITSDPRTPSVSKKINLYAINENCENYRTTSRIADRLDINGNGNTSEYVVYKSDTLDIVSPASLLTFQTLSNYDDNGNEIVSPQIAILDKSNNARSAQINVSITNNYSSTISETKIVGKIPFEGNTYQINGEDLGSTYSVIMKDTGITIPDSVKNYAKVYYSINESVTSALNDTSNNWVQADEVEDWTKIKTYLIDLSEYAFRAKNSLTFSYEIEIPKNIKYNNIAYSTHAIYYCLNTEEGKLRTQTEVNRLGIMIAKKYNLALTKYKDGTNTLVSGATYKFTDENQTRTAVTNNGVAIFNELYMDKEYTLKEIKSPDNYLLNEDEIKFTATTNDNGEPQINIISGTLRDNATFTTDDGFVLNLNVEDIAKYDVKILKTDTVTGEGIRGAKFKFSGGIYGELGRIFTSNKNGEILLENLILDTEYTLQETKADGYYVDDKIITFKIERDNSGNLVISTDADEFTNAVIDENDGVDKAVVNVNITNTPVPKYSLNINKQNDDGEVLAGTQFKLTSIDTENVEYATTDENGNVVFDRLYQFVEGKDVTGEYVLQETLATKGYITDNTEVKFKVEERDGTLDISILEGEGTIDSSNSDLSSITFNFVNEPIFKLTKTGDNDQLLPNAVFKITDLYDNPAVDANGNPIGELVGEDYVLTTDENGELTADLTEGMYKVIEIEAPEGYELPEDEEDRTYYVGIGESKEEETEFKLEWAESITGMGASNINDVKATPDGGYIIAGSFQGEIDINHDGTVDMVSYGGLDGLVAKFDKDGVLEWYSRFGDIGNDDFVNIELTSDGGYVVGGYKTTNNFEDALIIKLDASGNKIFEKDLVGDLTDEIKKVKVLSTGDIIAVGRFNSTSITLADGVTITNLGNYDGFIVSFGQNGNYKWSRGIGGTDSVSITGITETSHGIVVVVNFKGSITVNEEELAVDNSKNQESVLIAYSLNNEFQWDEVIKDYYFNSIEDLATDKDDNIFVVGTADTKNNIIPLGYANSYNNITVKEIVLKYSSFGENIPIISGSSYSGVATTVLPTEDGGFIVGGYSNEDKRFGYNMWTYSHTNGIMSKYDEEGNPEWGKEYQAKGDYVYYGTYAYKYNDSVIYGIAQLTDGGFVSGGNFAFSNLGDEKFTLISKDYYIVASWDNGDRH